MFIELLTKDGASEHINLNTVAKATIAEAGVAKLTFVGGMETLYQMNSFMAALKATDTKFMSISQEEPK